MTRAFQYVRSKEKQSKQGRVFVHCQWRDGPSPPAHSPTLTPVRVGKRRIQYRRRRRYIHLRSKPESSGSGFFLTLDNITIRSAGGGEGGSPHSVLVRSRDISALYERDTHAHTRTRTTRIGSIKI